MGASGFAVRLAVLLLAGGCAPISVSHYQSARPIGQGNHQFGGGVHIPKDGGQGTDVENQDGDPVLTHHGASLLVNNLDFEYHYGLTDRAEVHVQVFPVGIEAGARYSYLDTPRVKGSIDLSVGTFSGGYETTSEDDTGTQTYKYENDISGTYVDMPVVFSAHFGERFAVYGGPRVTRFDTIRRVKETDNGVVIDKFERSAGFFQAGAVIGLCIGKTVQLSPGVAFYFEPREYPIGQFDGSGIWAYPFIGLTFTSGQTP